MTRVVRPAVAAVGRVSLPVTCPGLEDGGRRLSTTLMRGSDFAIVAWLLGLCGTCIRARLRTRVVL